MKKMTSNNKKINALREGIGRLTKALDERWVVIQTLPDCSTANSTYYSGLTKAIDLLGGDWKRDKNGKHMVFIAGVTAPAEVDDED